MAMANGEDQTMVHRDGAGEVTDVNEYHLLRIIGSGSTATTYLCEAKNQSYAMKVFEKSMLARRRSFSRKANGSVEISTGMDQVFREIAIMKKLQHENVVRMFEVIDDEDEDTMFMVLEYVEGGPVLHWNEDEQEFSKPTTPEIRILQSGRKRKFPFFNMSAMRKGITDRLSHERPSFSESSQKNNVYTEQEAASITYDILNGLRYLHLHHIAHRDLKPENVLISKHGRAKIADFGVAHYFDDEEQKEAKPFLSRCHSRGQLSRSDGTYYFWSPEICSGGIFSAYAADMWALGVTVYGMITGRLPFTAPDPMGLFELIEESDPPYPSTLSKPAESFLRGLLCKDPDKRFSLEEAAAHPFLATIRNSRAKLKFSRVSVSQEEIDFAFEPRELIVIKSAEGDNLGSPQTATSRRKEPPSPVAIGPELRSTGTGGHSICSIS